MGRGKTAEEKPLEQKEEPLAPLAPLAPLTTETKSEPTNAPAPEGTAPTSNTNNEAELLARIASLEAQLVEKETAPAPAIPQAFATATSRSGTKILIANHHTAPILLPRSAAIGVNIEPIAFAPGAVTPIDIDEWENRKRNATVRHYLEQGLLSETRRVSGNVAVTEYTTANAPIPENLKTEAETAASNPEGAPITASVVKQNVTEYTPE